MPQSEFNVWSKWDPLKKVVIGTCVSPQYFEHVANMEIREKLQQIVIETQQDLDNLAEVCTNLGIQTYRVDATQQGFAKPLDPGKKAKGIRSMLYPRDQLAVIGNHLISADKYIMFNNLYPQFITQDILQRSTPWYELHHKHKIADIVPPSWTLVGKDLFIDTGMESGDLTYTNQTIRESVENWLAKWWPEITLHWVNIGGHNDSCFHTLKPGVLLSLHDVMAYEDTFPNWDICYLPDASYKTIPEFIDAKDMTDGKFWIPGEEKNVGLLNYINEWLDNWVGFVEETVFDVNCLVVDESTVLVNNYNKQVFDFLKKHKMEPIICPMRHRYFFDGGIHCVSLDLYREGSCESYIDYK